MDWTVADGKTYKDAVEVLLLSLGAHRSEVEIEEVGERKKLFGLGKKVIRVRGRIKDDALADIDDEASLKSLTSSLSSEIAKIGSGKFDEKSKNDGKRDPKKGRDRNRRPEKSANVATAGRPPRNDRDRGPDKKRTEVRHTPPPTAKVFGKGTASEVSDACVLFLTDVLKTMGVAAEVAGEENEGSILLNITSDAGGFIIGRKGETLEALSKIIEIHATRKKGSHLNVVVDTENYRSRREEKLVDQAITSAKKAIETGKKIRLAPMKTEERKTIHFTLQEDSRVETRSEGSDENRRVVIFPARGNKTGS